jgi:hypothetical protein
MARARNIKPSFFTHDELADNEPLGRLLFIGLWTIADYKGELEWRPKRVKAQVMPYDVCDIEALAINLEKTGFIRFYSVGGSDYVHIVNFNKHQNPHKNEKDKGSDVPAMTSENLTDASQVIESTAIDTKTDVIEINREENGTAPADSLFLIPDSCSLIPDTNTHESGKPDSGAPKVAIDFSPLCMTGEQIDEVKRIRRKNKCGSITQRVVNTLAKEFELAAKIGWGPEDILSEWEMRGWKGFKAEWVTPRSSAGSGPKPFGAHVEKTMETLKNFDWGIGNE